MGEKHIIPIKTDAAPVVKQAGTALGRELRLRAEDAGRHITGYPDDPVTCAELIALADAFDHQEAMAATARDAAERAMATTQQVTDAMTNMRIAIRLMRFYALNPVLLPDQDQVIAFLRTYIDDGRWLPIPWPSELGTCSKFLADAGYFDLDGFVTKAQPVGRTGEK